jgi:hypothetical protein
MLLNLDPDIVRSGPRLHSTCSKQHGGTASSSQWKKYIKYSVYHVTDLANDIVRKPHHM